MVTVFAMSEFSKSLYRDVANGVIRIWSIAIILFAINAALVTILSIFGIDFDIGFFSLVAAVATSYLFYGLVLFSVIF